MKIIAMILAGGRSQRMGTSKALLSIHGQRLIDRTQSIVEELRPLVDSVVISGFVPNVANTISDTTPFEGPLGGIASVATELLRSNEPAEGLLVVPVDLPLLTAEALRPLVEHFNEHRPTAVHFAGHWLPALFRLDEQLISGAKPNGSVRGLLNGLGAAILPLIQPLPFSNANTPEQWAQLTRSLK